MAVQVQRLWRWACVQAKRLMAPRPQKEEEWQWLRGAATNKSKFIFLYEKLSTGWPAPQPPRPIQPEPPEPELQFVFLEPCLVPELAYDTPTPTPMDDSASLPGGFKTLTVSGLLGIAAVFFCLAGLLRAKAKEERAARRRLRYLQ